MDSLFDVDTVMNITHKVSELTGAHYGETEKRDVSLRVITDHIRSATFMICDGVLPSNEGRGYVLRRLLRRAARHGKLLGVDHPFLYESATLWSTRMRATTPSLRERQAYITKVIRTEEENFAKTLDAGMKIYDEMLAAHKAQGETVFSGADAFKLYDTYGFPIDLTMEMAEEAGMTVDQEGFKALMEEQKVRARKAREALGDLAGPASSSARTCPPRSSWAMTAPRPRARSWPGGGRRDAGRAGPGRGGHPGAGPDPLLREMGGQVGDHGTIQAPTAPSR